MPPFVPLSRAIGSFITRGIGARRLLRPAMGCERLRRPDRLRCLSQIPGMHASIDCSFGTLCDKLQKRKFFSCSMERRAVCCIGFMRRCLLWGQTTALDSNLFDHLINTWEFNPGPVKGTCELHFLVDFKFLSPLYQVASMFFKEVVSRMIESFSGSCQIIYGPGVNVQEHTIQ